ncbi:unnamed protein product, partial [Ostreobium quekettii]
AAGLPRPGCGQGRQQGQLRAVDRRRGGSRADRESPAGGRRGPQPRGRGHP